MTRDGTVGRFRRNRAKPGVSSGHRSRLNDEDSVRGPHQGQQSTRTAPTGRTHDCKRPLRCTPNDLLPGGGHPHMKRRDFITLLGGAAAAWPLAARAQQQPVRPLIGILSPLSAASAARNIVAFRSGLRDLGYLEGRNATLEIRYGDGAPDRMAPLAQELVALKPDVLVAGARSSVLAAQAATRTIPIVIFTVDDPVALGLAQSIA